MANLAAKAQKNPTALLAILLIAHMIVVSINRVPHGEDNRRYLQVWVMTALMPAQKATAFIVSTVSHGWTNYVALRDARAENEQLRVERAELEARLLEAQQQLKLAEELEAFKEWQKANRYEMTMARVIARDASQWFNSVIIDRGTTSGVQQNQPVVTHEGLVGRVIYAAPFSSRVLLLTDERHGAGAIIGQLSESRLLGVVKGKSESLCEMRFVAAPEKVAPGEIVLTSGQDGIYPRGLVIGRIRRPEGEAAIASTIEVEPAAALGKLDQVAVLLIPPGTTRARVDEVVEGERERQEQASGRRRR